MKSTIYILLLLFSITSVAQHNSQPPLANKDKSYYLIDSLKLDEMTDSDKELIENSLKIYYAAKDDTSRVNALATICENMVHEDWHKYQYYQQYLIEKSLKADPSPKEKLRLTRSLANSLNNLGYIQVLKGNILPGINYYKRALKIQIDLKDKKGEAISYNNIGLVYYNQGDIPTSLKYFHASIKIKEEIGDKRGLANSYINIGGIYRNQGDIDVALKYYLKAHKYLDELEDQNGVAGCLNHIGFIYETRGDISLALEYYQKSLAIVKQLGNKAAIGISYGNIGNVYKMLNQIPLARRNLNNSLKIREEIDDKDGIVVSLIKLGQLDMDENKLDLARQKGMKAFQLANQIGYPKHIKISAMLLSQIYERQGKGMESLKMFKISTLMNDSINNETTQKASIHQQAKFEYEKQKVLDDAENEKLLAVEKEAKAKQKVITYATTGGLGLTAIFLFFVFNRLRVTRKQKKMIEEAHVELEEKNQEITDSITYAKRIQDAILPSLKEVEELLPNSFVFYQPKDIVAGDFYWVENIQKEPSLRGTKQSAEENEIASSESLRSHHRNDVVLFAAADCTGHGVPGAMVSVVCHNTLNRVIRDFKLTDPGLILDKTRELIVEQLNKSKHEEGSLMNNIRDGMDIALCSLKQEAGRWKLQYAGANNPLWVIRSQKTVNSDKGLDKYLSLTTDNRLLYEIKATKQAIGIVDNPVPFVTHTVELDKGDSIYIFSDGFADQFGGEDGKKLKKKAFKELLSAVQDKSMEEQHGFIKNAFEAWRGDHEQVDDVCIIGVRI